MLNLLDRLEIWTRQQYGLKTIGQVVRQYEDELTNAVHDAFRSGDAIDMRRTHRALLRSLAPDVYREGMREGGLNPEGLDREDEAAVEEAIDQWVSDQLGFVNDFAAAAANVKREPETREAVLGRIDQWVSSLRNFGEAGRLFALGNVYLTFDGDDGEESCEDCQRLKGQRHRRNWWADRGLLERNGNPHYECGRWSNCHHSFSDDSGEVVVS